MDKDDILEREYRDFVRAVNRERSAFDEYGPLAARDALTEAYSLNRYTAPKKGKPCEQAATAAQQGGTDCRQKRMFTREREHPF